MSQTTQPKPNPLRNLKSYVMTRIEDLQSAGKNTQRWAEALLIIDEVATAWNGKNARITQYRDRYQAVALELQQALDAAATHDSEIEALRNQIEDLNAELDGSQHKYKVPRPASTLLANVDAGSDIFLVASDPDAIESRMEFVSDPTEGVIGVAVWVDHNIKPYYFPFHEAFTPLEAVRGERLTLDNPEHALLIYQTQLNVAVDFADNLVEKYGALLGVRMISKNNDDSGRLHAPVSGDSDAGELSYTPVEGFDAASSGLDDDSSGGAIESALDSADAQLDITDEEEDDILPPEVED